MTSEQQVTELTKLIQESVLGCSEYWAQKIAVYLVQHGVIVPPVKIGQMVYQLRNNKHALGEGISPRIICGFYFKSDGWRLDHMGNTPCFDCDFNKTWFLSYEAAENALAASQTKGGVGT